MNETEMNETDTALVEQTVRISARPETVWKYWTDPQQLCEWWGVAAELDPRPGGMCRVEMASGPVMLGEYVELRPYDRLVFTFGYEPAEGSPAIAPGASRVEVTLVEDAGDTILTLRHTGIPTVFAGVHAAGWTQHLPLLVRAAG
jgi:uncharacterized protein YndB with AHSA1/START domain